MTTLTAAHTGTPTARSQTSHQVRLAVGGMTCGACAARIEYRLNKLDGVSASVSFAAERASITAPSEVTVAQLVGVIEAIGYRAAPVTYDVTSEDLGLADGKSPKSLGRRLLISSLLFMPLCDLSLVFWLIPVTRFSGWQELLFAIAAPVVTYCAWPFHRAALRGARHGTYSMDTLVSLGITSAVGWSAYSVLALSTDTSGRSFGSFFSHQARGASYLDVAAGVTTFLLAGRFFEASTRRRTGDALRSLVSIGAKDVAIVDQVGNESRLGVGALVVGDLFVVRPGEAVATDGEVWSGSCSLDRSAMTGESRLVSVGPGDDVLGGSVVTDGRLVVRATKVGRDTQLAHMIRLVEEAQHEKAEVQRLADRISRVFVPSVVAAALLTLAGWLLAGGAAERAVNASLSVLIIACPCALGLATPTALLVASGAGARRGIFFKGYQGLEASRRVDTVVLDKTGTVTSGVMTVVGVESVDGVDPDRILASAAAVEQASEHLLARAITARAREQFGKIESVEDFVSVPGVGVRGCVGGLTVNVGQSRTRDHDHDLAVGHEPLDRRRLAWEALGCTTAAVSWNGQLVGVIAVSDTVRETSAAAVAALGALGLRCILLTGDNDAAARAVGEAVGCHEVVSGVLPADKVAFIRDLQAKGHVVAMVGDGVNDGPALATADLGIAVGSGTDVAINAADLIVVRDDLVAVATAIGLARRTIGTIRGNLAWAFAYNLAALPAAACGLLNPLIAGAAMVLSSTLVVWNSARLQRS